MQAIILAKVSGSLEGNMERLLQIRGVRRVYELTGDIDLLIEVEASSETDLGRIIDEILGIKSVQSTDTCIVLSRLSK
ncbi:MAG: Lrp/AsnC ligand binding domain-containing protein [Thermoproteota archaeon]